MTTFVASANSPENENFVKVDPAFNSGHWPVNRREAFAESTGAIVQQHPLPTNPFTYIVSKRGLVR
jgi:hypothetical protein